MREPLLTAILRALAGCAGLPSVEPGPAPCTACEASQACQILRRHDGSA